MLQLSYKKVVAIMVGIVSLAVAGYFVGTNFKNSKDIVTKVTETPLVEIPEVTQTPSPSSEPATRLGYVRQQLLLGGFTSTQIDTMFADKRLSLYPIKQVAYKEPDWNAIKQKLYSLEFVQRGKDYLKANQAVFDKAELDYGVPKEVLVGIVAIETEFGVSSGTTLTFNALYSRMEQWPETKWKAQADQLVALSTYCFNSQKDCFLIKGSYAGALGIVQFMPDSLLKYGVDENKDGVVDLYNPVDAIPSAGNFLDQHGWSVDNIKALAGYYGSSIGYPEIVLTYASLLTK